MAADHKDSKTEYQRILYRDLLIIVAVLGTVAIAYTAIHVSNATESSGGEGMQALREPEKLDFGNATINQLVETGNHLMDMGRYSEAIMHYSAALDQDSSLVDVRVDRGSCYFAVQDFDKAIGDFSEALNIDDDHAIANFNLGITYHTLGQDSLTVAYWSRFLELSPTGELASKVREVLDEISNP